MSATPRTDAARCNASPRFSNFGFFTHMAVIASPAGQFVKWQDCAKLESDLVEMSDLAQRLACQLKKYQARYCEASHAKKHWDESNAVLAEFQSKIRE